MSLDLIIDIETDGLLPDVSKIHCIGMTVSGAEAGQVFANQEPYDCLDDALELMSQAKSLTGHNIIGYDLPVLKKLLGWVPPKSVQIIDTLVLSRLCHTDLMDLDAKEKIIVPKLWGSHSLKAWGERIKIPKLELGEGEEDKWAKFTPEMAEYCVRDISVTRHLKLHFDVLEYSAEAVELEHQFATVIQRQVEFGFAFNVKKGQELYVSLLKRQEELGKGLRDSYGSWYVSDGQLTPKKNNIKRGYTAGCTLTKIKKVEFNPNSRDHVAQRLKADGWIPKDFTPNGKPKIDETVLGGLQLPHCKELKEHFLISKRISQLAEGNNAWLKLERDGRIYGGVNTNGAVTGRCTHSRPNMAQVPASYSTYGTECRRLFGASKNRVLVGCDADGLELRCLAGYLHKYDGGAYAKAAVEGDKDKETDVHSLNRQSLNIQSRDVAKTFFYAFIYGAGDEKLGKILGKGRAGGKRGRADLLAGITGLMALTERVKQVFRRRGHLIGLDGRTLTVRSEHSALNTLLQGAGAILMKKALVTLDRYLQFVGFIPGEDYEFVANVHDEWQIECKKNYARQIGKYGEAAFESSGRAFEFGCKITGTYKTGSDWSLTH